MMIRAKTYMWVVAAGLFLSGITAFPLETELKWLVDLSGTAGKFHNWFALVYHTVQQVNLHYPYLNYGTDWLAFAHIMLAILFAGASKDPVRNKWVVQFGIIASTAIFPLAFVAGGIRQVPVFWRLIDCSFGVVALLLLWPCYRIVQKLEGSKNTH